MAKATPKISRIAAIGSGKLARAKNGVECVWSINLYGRKAWSNVSTDGFGDDESSKLARCRLTISSSDNFESWRSFKSGSSFTAGNPAASIVPRSHPDPLTHNTSIFSPKRFCVTVLHDVLPPPCMTRSGTLPIS